MPLLLFYYYVHVVHCGAPLAANGVVIDHFNDSMLGALITFHCEESDYPVMSICGSDRRWDPNPSSFDCPTTAPGIESCMHDLCHTVNTCHILVPILL